MHIKGNLRLGLGSGGKVGAHWTGASAEALVKAPARPAPRIAPAGIDGRRGAGLTRRGRRGRPS